MARIGVLVDLHGGEEAVSCKRKGADDEQAYQPDHCRDEDGHKLREGRRAHGGSSLDRAVVCDGDRNAPPSEGGVEACGEHPCAEEVVDFGGFVAPLFGSEDAGDSGKVNAAESDGKDGCPLHACKGEVAEHVMQGVLGGAEVEDFEGEQGGNDHGAPCRAPVELTVVDDAVPQSPETIPQRITTVVCHFDLLVE